MVDGQREENQGRRVIMDIGGTLLRFWQRSNRGNFFSSKGLAEELLSRKTTTWGH